jgi:hypothetical protein
VLFQASGEGCDAGQPGVAGAGDPLREVLAGELGEHGSERADLVAGGLEFGAAAEDGFEPGPLVLGDGVRAAGEPAGDVADGRRGRRQRFPGGAVPGEVVADDGVAAVVAERLDLTEQAEGATAAAVRVLVQVGLERVELARARPLPAAVGEFLPGGGTVVTLDGVQASAQVAGDLPARSPWTSAWCRWTRSAYFPAGSGCPASAGPGAGASSSAGRGPGSARQDRWAATHRSTALARFCHRWNRSATWTACGAPVRAPSA